MGPPGHLGVAFAAKPATPKAPLWALLVVSEALDILSMGFVAVGIEKMAESQTNFRQGVQIMTPGSIPWSHGLFMSMVWSLLFGGLAYLLTRDRRSSAITGLVVFSHWVLDFIVHLPDLPLLFAGSPEVGLGLWASGPGFVASMILEFVLLGGGVAIYALWRKKRNERMSP